MKKLVEFSSIFIFLFLMACSGEEKVPDYVWEEQKFVDVLTEFQLAESIVRLGYHRFPDSSYVNDSVYAAVFEKMGVSDVEFDSNYNYFLKNPERMELIYEQVITKLSERSAELEKK